MKRTLLPSALLAALLSGPTALGQIAFGGQPIGLGANKSLLPDPPLQVMPAVDVTTMMVEDAERAATGIKVLRFGKNHATDLSLDNSGAWTVLANGDRVWRLGIECPGAMSINFEFHTYIVPEGGKVFVYNAMGHTLGAFNADSHKGNTVLGVDLLQGDRVTVEYMEPAAVAGQGQLRIGQVTHGYRDLFGMAKGFGSSDTCNNNVVCPISAGYTDQIRSVAIMLAGGNGFCTGQLIDNCAHDFTPYFLSANHCMGGNPALWVFRFNWQSPSCADNINNPIVNSVSGATLLYSNSGSDVALLELNDDPPANYNVFFSGWDKSGATPTQVRAIHHPQGDIKKFSIDDDPQGQGTVNFGWGNALCWRVFNWEDGTTQPGSSGSGLWDQNGRLVGQLYGGQAFCANNINDYYGRFDISYPGLEPWLGSCGTSINGATAINDLEDAIALNGVRVYPNPGAGAFTVSVPADVQGMVRLRVTDALGRSIVDHTANVVSSVASINLGDEAEGLYNLEVMSGGAKSVHRLVVQR